jgi:hypothetical protein
LNKVLDLGEAAWKVHIFALTGIEAAALDYSAIAVDILDKISKETRLPIIYLGLKPTNPFI